MNTRLLVDGKQAFPRISSQIRKAKKKIEVSMFIWRNDAIGNKLLQELIAAAERGVMISLRKDEAAGPFEYSEEYRDSMFHPRPSLWTHIQNVAFRTMYPTISVKGKAPLPSALPKRLVEHKNVNFQTGYYLDHAKYWIFDDRCIIMGGINVEDREQGNDVRGAPWHDYMVEINDPQMVKRLREKIGGKERPVKNKDFIVNTKRKKRLFEMKTVILHLLEHAKKHVEIHMAYWGHPEITQALIDCAHRGVTVRLVISENSNIQHDKNLSVMEKIWKATNGKVQIYKIRVMLHAKLLLIDDTVLVGSSNLNRLAMTRVSELDYLHTGNDAFLAAVRKSLTDNLKRCTRVKTKKELQYRKWKALLEL